MIECELNKSLRMGESWVIITLRKPARK